MPRSASTENALGVVVRRLREERGESQEALAYRASITSGTLARMELGQSDPSFGTVRSVADALGVRLRDLAAAVEDEEAS